MYVHTLLSMFLPFVDINTCPTNHSHTNYHPHGVNGIMYIMVIMSYFFEISNL